jgi:antigen flippase
MTCPAPELRPAEPSADDAPDVPPRPARPRRHTYGQILRSSFLIGSSSALTVVTGLVRSKAIALLLGPAGFGLMGLYTSIVQLAQSVAGMGVNASGVREIAVAAGTGDEARIARTAAVVRRTSLVLGAAGAIALALLATPISVVTFGDGARAAAVALLSLAVLFGVVNGGQGALIQGLRRIPDLARMNALSGLAGAVATILLVVIFREAGVVPAVLATALLSLGCSWWYSRSLAAGAPALAAAEVRREAAGLLKLGFAFMASGILMTGAAYAVRILIVRQIGLQAAGLYQSAWTIGGMYVGFILQAMGADFYPRLTASMADRGEANRLVNEQAHVSLLLAGPGVIATLVLAPLVLQVLYSSAFGEAVEILRWICLGAALQVVTWPLGFIVVAEGKQVTFFAVELAYALVYVVLAAILVQVAGVNGAGMAFFGSYVFHGVLLYPIVRRLTGFRWSAVNVRVMLLFLGASGLVFGGFHVLRPWLAASAGVAVLALTCAYSGVALVQLVPPERLPWRLRRVVEAVRRRSA